MHHTMQLLKFTILSFILSALNARGQDKDSSHVYVFEADKPVILIKVAPGSKRFTPSSTDVQKADSLLLDYLHKSKDLKDISGTYHSYFRQYVGLIKPGYKRVYINAFCRKPDHFKENTAYPRGGGKCYFRTIINLGSLQIEDFNYNAPK